MSNLSVYLENKLLDHLVHNTAYTQPATLYFGLFTADPGGAGVIGELAIGTGGYARAAVTNNNVNFPQCSSSGTPTKANGAVIQFPTATAAWGTVTHWAIYDSASSATNMLMHGVLSSSRYVANGDSPKFAVGVWSATITNATSGGISDYTKRKLMDHVFGGPTYTPPGAVYFAIGQSLSGDYLGEITSSNGCLRALATFASASAGQSINSALATFTTNLIGSSVPVSHFGVFDDASSGNLLVSGPLTTARTANLGDTIVMPISGFVVTLV
ncbi:MAG: hypothetical protein WCO57_13970 [Verrucomicrobiota bacterium]